MKLALIKASTSQTVIVFILDSASTTGAGKTGIVFNAASLTAYYARPRAAAAAITLVTQTVSGGYSSGGFVEIDATNMPGIYRLDIPDAALATGVDSVVVMLKGAAGMAPVSLEIQLTNVNLNDGVRAGLTALPNAAAAAAGGLLISGSNAGTTTLGALTVTGATTFTGNVSCAAGVTVTQSTAGAAAVSLTGNAAGPGLLTTGGSTGHGVQILGGAISGDGLNIGVQGTGDGIDVGGGVIANITGNITGNLTGSIGSVSAGGIVAASFAANAINAAAIAVDAGTEIGTAVWATTTRELTAGTNIVLAKGTGVTGFNDLSSANVSAAVWDAATATYGSAGSYGLLFENNLDAAISSRLATGGYTAPDNASVGTILARVDVTTSSRMATFVLPGNFSALGISVAGKINGVVLADALTTYTGNTPQTGDAFARLATYRLDQLFTADVTAPVAGAMFGDLTEDLAGTRRFTVASLVNAPAGGGGGGGASAISTDSSSIYVDNE